MYTLLAGTSYKLLGMHPSILVSHRNQYTPIALSLHYCRDVLKAFVGAAREPPLEFGHFVLEELRTPGVVAPTARPKTAQGEALGMIANNRSRPAGPTLPL